MPEGDEPSALRWMAAKAEFPCGLPGGGGPSALRWMVAGVEFSCGVLGGCMASALWWMLWDVVLVVWGWRFLSKGFC